MTDEAVLEARAAEVAEAHRALEANEAEKTDALLQVDAIRQRAQRGEMVSPDELTRANAAVELATLRSGLVEQRLRSAQDDHKVALIEAKADAVAGSLLVRREEVNRALGTLATSLNDFAVAVAAHDASSLPGGITPRIEVDRGGRRIDGMRISPVKDAAAVSLARLCGPLFRSWQYAVVSDQLAGIVGTGLVSATPIQ